MGTITAPTPKVKVRHTSSGKNILHTIFQNHYDEFVEKFEDKYRGPFDDYRFERVQEVVEHFLECGDYTPGIARIRCSNPQCGHDYFVPFSCKTFYLCPLCHQKRTLLFAEHLIEEVLPDLPHRQFVFSLPKALRIYFQYDQRLFTDVSRLIFYMIQEFYNEAAARPLKTSTIIACQSFVGFLRANPNTVHLRLD